jgi:hypothetical protein
MWKSFVSELRGEWSKFYAEQDHSATPEIANARSEAIAS